MTNQSKLTRPAFIRGEFGIHSCRIVLLCPLLVLSLTSSPTFAGQKVAQSRYSCKANYSAHCSPSNGGYSRRSVCSRTVRLVGNLWTYDRRGWLADCGDICTAALVPLHCWRHLKLVVIVVHDNIVISKKQAAKYYLHICVGIIQIVRNAGFEDGRICHYILSVFIGAPFWDKKMVVRDRSGVSVIEFDSERAAWSGIGWENETWVRAIVGGEHGKSFDHAG